MRSSSKYQSRKLNKIKCCSQKNLQRKKNLNKNKLKNKNSQSQDDIHNRALKRRFKKLKILLLPFQIMQKIKKYLNLSNQKLKVENQFQKLPSGNFQKANQQLQSLIYKPIFNKSSAVDQNKSQKINQMIPQNILESFCQKIQQKKVQTSDQFPHQYFFIITSFQQYFVIQIYIQSMQNYSYLRPPSTAIRNSPSSHRFQGAQRLVSNENRLQPQQKQALLRLKQYLKTKYPNRQINDNLLLRYCYIGHFSTTQSVEKFRFYDQWWSSQDINKNKFRGIMHSGVFYCYGRDNDYAPNLYVHPEKIDLNESTIQDYLVSLRSFLIPIEDHMLVEGKIQQWNVLIDIRSFNDTKMKNNLPIILNNLIKICNAYPCRAKRIFIINPVSYTHLLTKVGFSSNGLNFLIQILKQLGLSDKIIHVNDFSTLNKYINIEEREKKYGGVLQDLTEFWPICSTNRLMQVNSQFIQGSQVSQTEYQSVANDGNAQFFGQKHENTPKCRCSIQ